MIGKDCSWYSSVLLFLTVTSGCYCSLLNICQFFEVLLESRFKKVLCLQFSCIFIYTVQRALRPFYTKCINVVITFTCKQFSQRNNLLQLVRISVLERLCSVFAPTSVGSNPFSLLIHFYESISGYLLTCAPPECTSSVECSVEYTGNCSQ